MDEPKLLHKPVYTLPGGTHLRAQHKTQADDVDEDVGDLHFTHPHQQSCSSVRLRIVRYP